MTRPLTIGQRITAKREARGLSQQALADRCGIKTQNLNRVERDKRLNIRSDTIIALCRALGCSSDYLLGLDVDEEDEEHPAA